MYFYQTLQPFSTFFPSLKSVPLSYRAIAHHLQKKRLGSKDLESFQQRLAVLRRSTAEE